MTFWISWPICAWMITIRMWHWLLKMWKSRRIRRFYQNGVNILEKCLIVILSKRQNLKSHWYRIVWMHSKWFCATSTPGACPLNVTPLTYSLIPLNVTQIIDVYSLFDEYLLKSLKETISKYLAAKLSVNNCFEIFNAADLCSQEDLQNKCLTFMDRRSTELIKHDTFKSISPALLCTLLKRNTFCASEIDIFNAVKDWITNSPKWDILQITGCPLRFDGKIHFKSVKTFKIYHQCHFFNSPIPLTFDEVEAFEFVSVSPFNSFMFDFVRNNPTIVKLSLLFKSNSCFFTHDKMNEMKIAFSFVKDLSIGIINSNDGAIFAEKIIFFLDHCKSLQRLVLKASTQNTHYKLKEQTKPLKKVVVTIYKTKIICQKSIKFKWNRIRNIFKIRH